jgi:hypothetical protein
MKDKQRSDEELFDELDTMYQRVADLEGKEAAPQHPSTAYDYGETTEEAASRINWARTKSGSTAALSSYQCLFL